MVPRPSTLAVLVAGKKGPRHPRGKESAVPRIDSRKCLPEETKGKNKTDLPTNLKWQIGLLLCLKPPFWGVAACRRGDNVPPSGDSKGRSPWRFFGDFLIGEKVTRGRRGGAPSTLRVEAKSGDLLRELCSHKGSAEGATPPRKEAGAAGPKGQHQRALRRRRTASSSASVSKRSVLIRA